MRTIILLIVSVVIAVGLIYQIGFHQKKTTEEENTMQNQNTNQLKIEILKEGTGESAKNGNTVVVDYTGILESGVKFDSSIDRGQPFSFLLGAGQVIAGWDQGVLGMKVGEKRKLTIAPELAYGASGAGGVIPPNATLILKLLKEILFRLSNVSQSKFHP